MTDKREVLAYVLAHLAGYVVGFVVNTTVMAPIFRELGVARSYPVIVAMSFAVYAVIQVGVFFLFLAIRNRKAAGE
jgi:hypothetical protein